MFHVTPVLANQKPTMQRTYTTKLIIIPAKYHRVSLKRLIYWNYTYYQYVRWKEPWDPSIGKPLNKSRRLWRLYMSLLKQSRENGGINLHIESRIFSLRISSPADLLNLSGPFSPPCCRRADGYDIFECRELQQVTIRKPSTLVS